MNHKEKIAKAKLWLMINHPFFGALLAGMKIEPREDLPIKTAGTDGERIYYDPGFIDKQTVEQTSFVLMHEVMHAAMLHALRCRDRDRMLWNVATDYAINLLIVDDFKFGSSPQSLPNCGPDGGILLDREYAGMTAEEIYDQLKQSCRVRSIPLDELLEPGSGGGEGISPERAKELEQHWRDRLQQAATVAKMAGKLPQNAARLVDRLTEPKVNWKSLLHEFVERALGGRDDYWWRLPNRRFVGLGCYLPSMYEMRTPPLVVAIDTSGSISEQELRAFISELNGIREQTRPTATHVLYIDALIARVEQYEPDEDIDPRPAGGGGTDFRPAFKWIREQGIRPCALIYFTDGHGPAPAAPPEYPVLWLMKDRKHTAKPANWGQVVYIDEEEGA